MKDAERICDDVYIIKSELLRYLTSITIMLTTHDDFTPNASLFYSRYGNYEFLEPALLAEGDE